jgi:hypothetical protein
MKRTRIGSSLAVLLLLPAAGLTAAPPVPLLLQKSVSYALVAGTVFRDSGFSLPNAEVQIEALSLPAGVKKFRPQRLATDSRGEFAFRLPAASAAYRLTIRAEGYQTAQRDVTVTADERSDVFVELQPAPGRK